MHATWASRSVRRQAGSAAIIAIAVIILVGFIGSALVHNLCVADVATANNLSGIRAAYVADAGTEWAVNRGAPTSGSLDFGGGSFEVSQEGDAWVCQARVGEAQRTVRCRPEVSGGEEGGGDGSGLMYILGSREESAWGVHVEFLVINVSGSPITFDRLTVSWSSPTAYFQEVEARVLYGTDYDEVWRWRDNGYERWGSGETHAFNHSAGSVTVPAHSTAEIQLKTFRNSRTGWLTGYADMNGTEVAIEFLNGAASVGQITVGLPPS
jgi:hypothetical protein